MQHEPITHEISRLHIMFHWVMDTWQAAVLIVGAMISWAVWWMHHMFVSQKTLESFKKKNSEEHATIADDVRFIKNHLIRRNGDE